MNLGLYSPHLLFFLTAVLQSASLGLQLEVAEDSFVVLDLAMCVCLVCCRQIDHR